MKKNVTVITTDGKGKSEKKKVTKNKAKKIFKKEMREVKFDSMTFF